jgi:hypothetical protein
MQLHPEIYERQNQSLEEIRCDVLYRATELALSILTSQEASSVVRAPISQEMFISPFVKEVEARSTDILSEAENRAIEARNLVQSAFVENSFATHLVQSQEQKNAA